MVTLTARWRSRYWCPRRSRRIVRGAPRGDRPAPRAWRASRRSTRPACVARLAAIDGLIVRGELAAIDGLIMRGALVAIDRAVVCLESV